MNFYVLTLHRTRENWDIARGFVVQARDEDEARYHASENAGGEGGQAWLNRSDSDCELLTGEGNARVILRDFKAG